MKHVPFDSIYRADYEVVEQREGNTSLYPHTGQLPVLARAMDLEFHGALPPRIARVDARADGFHKILLAHSAMLFCGAVNGSRSDNLRLIHLPTPDLVTRVAVVQQLTTTTPRGLCHRFRFYTRDGFLPDIHLSGKRLVFSDHVLQRFSARAPDKIGSDLTTFFLVFYGSPLVAMPVGAGRAFVVQYLTSILAFAFKETASEYFLTTCLGLNEINSLHPDPAPDAYNLHFGAAFTRPEIRNWSPARQVELLHRSWERKTPLPPADHLATQKFHWHHMAHWIKDTAIKNGHGPGSRISFMDNLPGPFTIEIRPGHGEWRYDEREARRKGWPETGPDVGRR